MLQSGEAWLYRFGADTYRMVLLLALVLVWMTAPAMADDAGPALFGEPGGSRFSLAAGLTQQFNADLERSGQVNIQQLIVSAGGGTALSDSWAFGLRGSYTRSTYDFSGTTGLAGLTPWEHINQVSLGLQMSYRASAQWRFFGGPLLGMQAEDGAALGEGLTVGGIMGAMYQLTSHLTLGLGLGIASQLEGEPRLFPFPVLVWDITQRWRLLSRRLGGELQYTLRDTWLLALGTSSASARFRLDSAGVAPDGLGQVSRRLIQARVAYAPVPALRLELRGGVALPGELVLDDRRGNRIRQEDVGASPFAGLLMTLPF